MKKILLIIALLFSVETFPQIRVQDMDSINASAMQNTDLFWINRMVSGQGLHRKLSWNNLKLSVKDYIDDLPFTWSSIQTFNGAVFNSGAHGGVIFYDSVTANSAFYMNGLISYSKSIIPLTNDLFSLGISSQKYATMHSRRIYADQIIVPNSGGTDSVTLSYNDGRLIFDRNIVFGDTTKGIGNIGAQLRSVTTDTLQNKYRLVIKSKYSTIKISSLTEYAGGRHSVNSSTTSLKIDSNYVILSTTNVATIDTLYMMLNINSAFDYVPVVIMNEGAFNVTFKDNDGAGFAGCMRLNGDAVLYQWDILMLNYYPNSQIFVETGRSINRYQSQYGTYTPTITNGTNIAGSTAFPCQFSRVGNIVTVSGKIAVDPTVTGQSNLQISLPPGLSSNFNNDYELGGTASGITVAESGGLYADTSNKTAKLEWITASSAIHTLMFMFQYQIK